MLESPGKAYAYGRSCRASEGRFEPLVMDSTFPKDSAYLLCLVGWEVALYLEKALKEVRR